MIAGGQGLLPQLHEMYDEWPFFQSLIDLIEMILAKADMRIAELYDDVLVDAESEKAVGRDLRARFAKSARAILKVCRPC